MHPLLYKASLIVMGGILAAAVGFFGIPEYAIAPTELVPAVLAPATISQNASSTSTLSIGPLSLNPLATSTTETSTATSSKSVKKMKPPTPLVILPPKIILPQLPILPVTGPSVSPTPSIISTVTQSIQTTTTPAAPISDTDKVRAAVVNIVCTTESSGPFNSISGSGVLIDSRGVVLTNSHVAQFFLLKDYPKPNFVSCVIRTGSPANPRYTAELLYFPPSWMAKNAHKITEANPTGNGEHDWALLRITGSINPKDSLPSTFPHLAIATNPPVQDESTILAAYPAGFLGGITIAQALYEASANATVGDVYTFGTDSLDLFSIGGTVIAQRGSSGGAVANDSATLIGLIVTATDAPDTASRDLRAIDTSYIIRDFQNESGSSLRDFLTNDIASEAHTFAVGSYPTLSAELIHALEQK